MRPLVKYTILFFTALVLLAALLSVMMPIELLYSVEQRLISPTGGFIYVVYKHGSIMWVNYTPLYIYAWRFSSTMFLLWVASLIIMVVKPMRSADLLSAMLALAFAVSNYLYLFTIGAKITILPLIYILDVVGKPVLFIDPGQFAILYAAWRIYKGGFLRPAN